jgi:hypothetical protein
MKTKWITHTIPIALLLALLPVAIGCGGGGGSDGGDEIPPTDVTLPVVPEPQSATDALPAESDSIVVGMSNALDEFAPRVQSLEMMQDNGSLATVAINRQVSLVCDGMFPMNSANPTVAEPYLADAPRILHTRHWRKLQDQLLSPTTAFELSATTTVGQSTTDTNSAEFSRTVGVEVSAGGDWAGLSASVTASYEETSTIAQVKSVTFETQESVTKSYQCGDASFERVCALWQLVDAFSFVDANRVPIDQSNSLWHVAIDQQPTIEFPSGTNFVLKVTRVD